MLERSTTDLHNEDNSQIETKVNIIKVNNKRSALIISLEGYPHKLLLSYVRPNILSDLNSSLFCPLVKVNEKELAVVILKT